MRGRSTALIGALLLAACGESAYDRAVLAMTKDPGNQRRLAEEVGGPHSVFLLGMIAMADCDRAEQQAMSAEAEPFAFDVAIAYADGAAAKFQEAAMTRADWPAARRNSERALLRAAELRRKKAQLEDKRRRDQQPEPKLRPEPKPQPEGKGKTTETDPELAPHLTELPPAEVLGIIERLARKQQEKRSMRQREREKRTSSTERDW